MGNLKLYNLPIPVDTFEKGQERADAVNLVVDGGFSIRK